MLLGYAHRDIKSFLVPPNCKRYIHTIFFLCVSLGSLYMCNMRVCYVCVHVLQITTVSLSIKLSFLYFSLYFPSPHPRYIRVYSEIIYCVYTWTAFLRESYLARRQGVPEKIGIPQKMTNERRGKKIEKKKKEKKRRKKFDPRRPIIYYRDIIYIYTSRFSIPRARFSFPLPPFLPSSISALFCSPVSSHFHLRTSIIVETRVLLVHPFYNWHCIPFALLKYA